MVTQLDGSSARDVSGATVIVPDNQAFFRLNLISRSVVINCTHSILTLLSSDSDQIKPILVQVMLTQVDMRMILPLFSYQNVCDQAMLLAALECEYNLLLRNYLLDDTASKNQFSGLIVEARARLNRVQGDGQRTVMKGVYNAIFYLRQKLAALGVTVLSKGEGYYLALFNPKKGAL